MFDSLLEGKESLQEMAISQSVDMDSPIKRILLDYEFWEKVVSSLKLLKPIAVAIVRIEGENAILSDVQTLRADVREKIQAFIKKIQSYFIKCLFKIRYKYQAWLLRCFMMFYYF